MDNSGFMRGFERICDLDGDLQNLKPWQRFAGDHVLEGGPLQQFHHDEGLSLELVNLVDSADVGMIETGGGAGLALKPFQCLGVADQFGRQEFQRDASSQSQILSAVDDAHAATAQLLFDPVM